MAVTTVSTIDKNARIANAAPTTALSDGAGLYIMNRSSNTQRSLISFTTPASSGTITKVELFLYCNNAGGGNNTGYDHNLHQVTQPNWVQSEVTWNAYSTGNSWSTAGGDFSATIVDHIAEPTTANQYYSWTIFGTGADNEVTIDWNTQYHFILKSANESGGWGDQYARVYNGTSAASNKPYIKITYEATSDVANDLNTNLVSVWLSDDSGLTTDLHGTNTLTNSGVTLTTGLNSGDAGDFERSDSTDNLYIADGSQTDLDFGSSDFTIACWVDLENLPSTEENYIIVDKLGSGTGYRFDIRQTGGNNYIRAITRNGSQSVYQVQHTLSTSGFQQIVFSKSGSTVEIYVNNSSIGSGSATSTVADSSADFLIGNEPGGGDAFDGIIHQLLIVKGTAWGSSEVSTHYNGGSGIEYGVLVASDKNPLFSFGGM